MSQQLQQVPVEIVTVHQQPMQRLVIFITLNHQLQKLVKLLIEQREKSRIWKLTPVGRGVETSS